MSASTRIAALGPAAPITEPPGCVPALRVPVANALVPIDVLAGGRVSSAWVTTDETGRFVRDSLLPGLSYVIEARCGAYRKAVSSPIVASADTLRTVELVLQVEPPQRTVADKRARSPED